MRTRHDVRRAGDELGQRVHHDICAPARRRQHHRAECVVDHKLQALHRSARPSLRCDPPAATHVGCVRQASSLFGRTQYSVQVTGCYCTAGACSGAHMAVRDLRQPRQVRDDERGVGDGLHIQRLCDAASTARPSELSCTLAQPSEQLILPGEAWAHSGSTCKLLPWSGW